MSDSKQLVSEQFLLHVLLIAIAFLLVLIYNDYSVDMFNEFEYALARSLGGIDSTLAGN